MYKREQVSVVIQATHNSMIFPGKSMVKIAGKTVLEHIVARIKKVKLVSEIILATSDTQEDNILVNEALRLHIKVARGSKSDVVSRLCKAVADAAGKTIVKVNGNCPLFDPFLANDLINEHLNGDFEFSN